MPSLQALFIIQSLLLVFFMVRTFQLQKRVSEEQALTNDYIKILDERRLHGRELHYRWLLAVAELWSSRALQRDTTPEQDAMARACALDWQAKADAIARELDSENYNWCAPKETKP
jgi:hypothetical protein